MTMRIGGPLTLVLLVGALLLLPSCGGGGEPAADRPAQDVGAGSGTAPSTAPPAVQPAPAEPAPTAEPAPAATAPVGKPAATPAPPSGSATGSAAQPAHPAQPAAAEPPAPTPPKPAPAPAPKPAAQTMKVVDPGGTVAVAATKPGLSRIGAEKCKVCHKVQYASWAETAHAKRTPLLDCESCHGPGSEYKSMTVMKDPEQARAAGLVEPDKAFCATCHQSGWTDDMLVRAHAHKEG